MKKLFALLLALTMVFSLATAASAVTIEVGSTNRNENHTFDVYQIFVGDLEENKLSNLKYGINFGTANESVTDEKLAEYKLIKKVENTETGEVSYETITDNAEAEKAARDFAKWLMAAGAKQVSGDPIAQLNSTNLWKATADKDGNALPAGYYLIVDTSTNLPDGWTMSQYIVEIRDDAVISLKAEKPESNKKVKDVNDTTGAIEAWKDSADHDVGDEVEFQITFKLPADYDKYDTYEVTVHDRQSAGLTFNRTTVKVMVGENNITNEFTVQEGTEITDDEKCDATDECTFHITCEDIKKITPALKPGDEIIFTYTSTLNNNAVLGATGNPNEMDVEFSNNPEGEGTNNTPDDTVIVFTYSPIVDKVDEELKPLKGAEFALYKQVKGADPEWVLVESNVTINEDTTTFGFKGIDDGTYKLEETKTPAGYNSIDPVVFTVEANHQLDAENPTLIKLEVTSSNAEFDTDINTGAANGNIHTKIVNKQGSTLPETGGMGTTLFYIVGGFMVVAAAILLVTKKRMSVEG